MLKNIPKIFCTSFGLGYVTKFPGTLASLTILPFIWALKSIVNFQTLLFIFTLFCIFSFFICSLALKNIEEKDPSYIVIDEYVGQFLSLLFCEETILNYFFGFIFFRIFDILKPFPINFFDKLNNSFGVIMDDIVAGIFSATLLYFVIKLF